MKKYLFSCVLASILLTQSATAVEFQEGFSGNLSIGVGARDIKVIFQPWQTVII